MPVPAVQVWRGNPELRVRNLLYLRYPAVVAEQQLTARPKWNRIPENLFPLTAAGTFGAGSGYFYALQRDAEPDQPAKACQSNSGC